MRLSTLTAVCRTNATITDLAAAFERLQPTGDPVVCAKYKSDVKVCAHLAGSKAVGKPPKRGFRNAITLIVNCGDKNVNVKVCASGNMQLTGCKGMHHAQSAVRHVYRCMRESMQLEGEQFTARIHPVMTNYDIRLGYTVNRKRLDEILNDQTGMLSMVEISFGYPGVICKMPVDDETVVDVHVLHLLEPSGVWTHSVEHDRAAQGKFTTFMVFQSGAVIASGQCSATIQPHVDAFMRVVNQHRASIQMINPLAPAAPVPVPAPHAHPLVAG